MSVLTQEQKKLVEDGTRLWTERRTLEAFWQEVAENFYPEMASFTINLSAGKNFADNLTTSVPLIARRTLGDAFSALLRPVNLDTVSPGVWFSNTVGNEAKLDVEGRRWLEWSTKIQRKAMYDSAANFTRATKEADHSFSAFGQAPMSREMSANRDTLLYRSHHLKDVVWTEGPDGKINHIQYRWKPTASQYLSAFKNAGSDRVKTLVKDSPYKPVECRRIVIAAEDYEQRDMNGRKFNQPWVSLWVDVDNNWLIEEKGSRSRIFIIPRWMTIPGSQYSSSPAVTAGLPDARLLQAMALSLLDAGERMGNPPMAAVQEALRSDVDVQPGGITMLDAEYDERMGDALRPLQLVQGNGLNVGLQMSLATEQRLAKAFFLDALNLPPPTSADVTAYEFGFRVAEWIRKSMPIFEPILFDYNAPLCEDAFDELLHGGAFGSWQDIPQSIRGQDIIVKFESPIHESQDKKKGQQFLEAQAALVQAAQIDPSVVPMLDARQAMRDVLTALAPAKWQRSDTEIDAIVKQQQAQKQIETVLAGANAAADTADKLGSAAKGFASAQAA